MVTGLIGVVGVLAQKNNTVIWEPLHENDLAQIQPPTKEGMIVKEVEMKPKYVQQATVEVRYIGNVVSYIGFFVGKFYSFTVPSIGKMTFFQKAELIGWNFQPLVKPITKFLINIFSFLLTETEY